MTTREDIHVYPSSLTLTPVHLHGHSFQVLHRSDENEGHFDPSKMPPIPANPVRRDVLLVKAGGYAILAFRADNPGAWYSLFLGYS